MPDGFEVDLSDLNKLVADLGAVDGATKKFVRKAVEVTARNVKDDWRKPLEGSPTIPGGARTISYDIEVGDTIEAEIGPELRGQGPVVGILEFGTPTRGPLGYGAAALQRNENDFVDGLTKAIDDGQRAAGL